MPGSPPHRDYKSQPRGYYRDRDRGSLDNYDSYKPQNHNSSPILSNRRDRSPPRRERSPPWAPRYDRSETHPQRDRQSGADRRDSRSPKGLRTLTKEPTEPTARPPAPNADERQISNDTPPSLSRKPFIAAERQIPNSNSSLPLVSTKPSIADVTLEARDQVSHALSLTLSEMLAQLCDSNIGIMTSILEKQNSEHLRKDAKSLYTNQKLNVPHGAKFPAMERRQKKNSDEIDMNFKSICTNLEQRQATLKSDCERIAANVVPSLLAATQNLHQKAPKEDVISEIEKLAKRCDALDADTLEQKRSLLSTKTIASNLLKAHKSQDENSKSSAEKQESEFSALRRQYSELQKESLEKFSELGKRLVRADDIVRNYSMIEKKINETESSLSELRSRQNQADEKSSQHKSKFEEHFKDFSNFKGQVGKQISERKSVATQANSQQSPDAPNILTGRVDVLESSQKAHSVIFQEHSTRIDTLLDQIGDLLSDQGNDSIRLTDLIDKVQGVSAWQNEVNSKLAAAATKEELQKVEAKVAALKDISTWQSEINYKLADVPTRKELKEVEGNASATARLLDDFAHKSATEIQLVRTSVDSSVDGQSKTLETLKGQMASQQKKVSPNDESLGIKNFANELADVKKDIQRLKSQAKEHSQSATARMPAEDTPLQEPTAPGLKDAIEEVNQSIAAQFEGLEDFFGGEVNNLKATCKALEDDITKLKDADSNLDSLFRGDVNELKTTCKALEDDIATQVHILDGQIFQHGNQLNQLKESTDYLKDSSQANAHALVNLESRYNNLTTGDIYQAMAQAFSEDMHPRFAQFPEYAKHVEQIHMRTVALEAAPTRKILDELLLTVGQIQTRLSNAETTTHEGIEQHRNEMRTQLDSFKAVMISRFARLQNDTSEENEDTKNLRADEETIRNSMRSTPNGVDGSRKRHPAHSPGPSLSNGTWKKQKLAPEESEEQVELD